MPKTSNLSSRAIEDLFDNNPLGFLGLLEGLFDHDDIVVSPEEDDPADDIDEIARICCAAPSDHKLFKLTLNGARVYLCEKTTKSAADKLLKLLRDHIEEQLEDE